MPSKTVSPSDSGAYPQSPLTVNYTVSCASEFRDAIMALAKRQKMSLGAIARAIIMTFPESTINAIPDPGEPAADDRVPITLKSGAYSGKQWQRKPRIQLRLQSGYRPQFIRQVLAFARSLDDNSLALTVAKAHEKKFETSQEQTQEKTLAQTLAEQVRACQEQSRRYKTAFETLAFAPREQPCQNLSDVAYIMSLEKITSLRQAQLRYRELVRIYHPDTPTGDSARMLQLNDAMEFVRTQFRERS